MNKKIILVIIIFIIIGAGFFIYRGFVGEEKPKFVLVEVTRGDARQEISEIGTVRVDEIGLNFKGAGRIEKIYVEVGQEVKKGDILAKLETEHLEIQLRGAKAGLSSAKAKLAELLAGTSEEEIRVAETSVDSIKNSLKEIRKGAERNIDSAKADVSSAQVALVNANQNLVDVKSITENNLRTVHQSALNVLNDSALRALDTFNVVDTIQRRYFTHNDQQGIKVRSSRDEIKRAKEAINPKDQSIDLSLLETRKALDSIFNNLSIIRKICDESIYRHEVSSASRASLDAQKLLIRAAFTSITGSQSAIFSARSDNQARINSAEALIASTESALISAQKKLAGVETKASSSIIQTEGELKIAQDRLSLKQAKPRQEVINFHQSQIAYAKTKVQFFKNQIQEVTLYSPIDGKIIEINKEMGEIFAPGSRPFIFLIPTTPFQIEVAIHEEDIALIEIGDTVEIEIFAFPDQIFRGRVASIEPMLDTTKKAATGMVFYQVIIDFKQEVPKGLKLGMTGDVMIITDLRQGVLIIPEDAIQEKNGKFIVQVFKDGQIEEREIEIGLKGEDDKIEVISGLQEGEEIVI